MTHMCVAGNPVQGVDSKEVGSKHLNPPPHLLKVLGD